jgi:hypothetical protein
MEPSLDVLITCANRIREMEVVRRVEGGEDAEEAGLG